MKFQVLLLTSLLFFIACDDTVDSPIPANESLIVGNWIQTEAFISSGGPQYWVDVEDGEEIKFSEDGTFSSNRFTECMVGTFSIEENKLLLKYTCDGFETQSENEAGFITYELDFYATYFILTPTSGPICIEGCSYKYQSKK